MKKLSLLFSLVLLGFTSFSVFAESQDSDKAERIKLSKDLHDIRHIRDRINTTIAAAANTLPAGDREDFAKYVQLHIDYDALEAKSIQYAAEIYTVPELKAMISYFGSADGQSAEAKGADYSMKITKDIAKNIDAAIAAAKFDGVENSSSPAPVSGQKTGGKMPAPNVSRSLLDEPQK